MKITVVVPPTERVGSDSTGEAHYFAFRLVGSLFGSGHEVRLFATNDSESAGVRGEGPFEVAENGAQSNIVRQYQLACLAYEESAQDCDVIVDLTDVGPLVCARESDLLVLAPVVKNDSDLRTQKIEAFAHSPSNVRVFPSRVEDVQLFGELILEVVK